MNPNIPHGPAPRTGVAVNGHDPQSLSVQKWLLYVHHDLRNGWTGPLPIGKEHKGRYKDPWVASRHGFNGTDATPDQFEHLAEYALKRITNGEAGVLALGQRLPAGVLGIDVDAYDGKNGAETLRDWETRFGPLPATYIITARRDGVSGIRLYRVPFDHYPKEIPGSGVEFLDHHHRYIAVPPSWHHTGARYALYLPSGKRSKSGVLPPIDRIPWLPESYLDGLPVCSARAGGGDATDDEIAQFAATYSSGPQPEAVQWIIKSTIGSLHADGTYNPTRDALCWAAREAKGRRFGWDNAVDQIHCAAVAAYETRGGVVDEAEFARLVAYAVGEVRNTDEQQLYDDWQSDAYKTAVADNGRPGNAGNAGNPSETAKKQRVLTWRTGREVHDDVAVWAWEYDGRGRTQLATLCLLAGRPGAGKSTAARYFAAGFTLGVVPGCFFGQPQHVAYIASEESLEYMVKPSLRAHQADMDFVHFPRVEFNGNEVSLSSVADEAALTEDLVARGIRVVFVDPVMSAIGSKVKIGDTNQVREVLQPLTRIAQAIDGVVFGIVHLVKAPGGDVVAAINGSSAFGEVARSIFAFAKDHQSTEGIRIMSQEKNSAGTEDLALEYSLVPTLVQTDSGNHAEVVQFKILGPSSRRVSDVLQVDPKQRNVASDGTKTAEVLQAAHELGGEVAAIAIAGRVGISPDTAGKLLRNLVDAGLLIKARRGFYKVRELD